MMETLAAFNSIEMLGGHAFSPPIGPTRYKRVQERSPVRTKDGWITMLPYSGDNWCAFFEAVGHPECIEEFAVQDRVERGRNIDRIYKKMAEIAMERTTAEWEALLLEIDVPHTAFTELEEVAEQPHLKGGRTVQRAVSSNGRHARTGTAANALFRVAGGHSSLAATVGGAHR